MQAIEYFGPEADNFAMVEVALSTLTANQVLIKVAAAGVNRPDILQRRGLYPPPAGACPRLGLEVAGTIVERGSDVGSAWPLGARVCALVNGGGYAQYCIAEQGSLLSVPEGLTDAQAASLPEVYFTVWHNLWQRAALQPGERVLIHGGAGGIGSAAVQLAAAHGCEVVATAGSDAKCEFARSLGASVTINYREQDFVEPVRQLGGADVVLDMVGGDYIAKNIRAAAPDARIVNIAFLQGSKVNIDFMPVMLKRLQLTGSTLRSQSEIAKAAIARELREHVWPLFGTGQLIPVVQQSYPMAEVHRAHHCMESGELKGKLVLINE